jgi:Mg2+ and Co2+ transporter CorA
MIELDEYDAGLLPSSFDAMANGWWHAHIRAILADAHDFYVDQVNNRGLKEVITLEIGVAMKQLQDNPELAKALNALVIGDAAQQIADLERAVMRLQDLLYTYGDRKKMSFAHPSAQPDIDEAMAAAYERAERE